MGVSRREVSAPQFELCIVATAGLFARLKFADRDRRDLSFQGVRGRTYSDDLRRHQRDHERAHRPQHCQQDVTGF